MNDTTAFGHLGGVTERPRYYARQLVTPTELNLEASYFLDRLRRHNRLLHGWGVVCGAVVCRLAEPDGTGAQPWKVQITPGHLLDPYGNEIAITSKRTFDLRSGGVTVAPGDPPGELDDPWCSDVWTEPQAGRVWVAIRYHQALSRPVRVQPAGCDCDDSSCEYSRWCDGYQVGVLDHCPESHQGDPPTLEDLLGDDRLPECPPDPTDPWVVLASVDVDSDGTITAVDNCSCRRLVVSLAPLWRRCQPSQLAITKAEATPPGPHTPGQADIELNVTGSKIAQGASVNAGQGVKITAQQVEADGTAMKLTVRILKSAQPGDRDLTITNPDCTLATAAAVLIIQPAPPSPPKRRRRT
jgi:hypothetical protein